MEKIEFIPEIYALIVEAKLTALKEVLLSKEQEREFDRLFLYYADKIQKNSPSMTDRERAFLNQRIKYRF